MTSKLDLSLNKDVEPLPVDSEIVDPRPLRARPQVPGDRPRRRPTRATRPGRRMPVTSAVPEPVDIDEFSATFDEPTRVAIQAEPGRVRQRPRRPRPRAELGDRRAAPRPLRRPSSASTKNLASPRHQARRASSRRSQRPPPRWRRSPRSRRRCSPASTPPSAPSPTSPGPSSRRRSPRRPPTLDVGTRALPGDPAVPRELDGAVHRAPAGRRGAARDLADDRLRARGRRAGAARLAEFNEQLAPTAAALRTPQQRRRRPRRHRPPAADAHDPRRRPCASSPRRRRSATTRRSCSATCQSLLRAGHRPRHLPARRGHHRSSGKNARPDRPPNNEGAPSSAPANGGGTDAGNFLHTNPYPNTAAPGQEQECEAGNEGWLPGQQVIGNVPGNQGTNTDDTAAP